MGAGEPRHTSQEFVAFLADLVASQPRGREIHIIADNFSAHKNQTGAPIPGVSSQSETALHADLLILAQPGGTLVCENRMRCYRARHLHFGYRSQTKTDEIYPSPQPDIATDQMEIH